MPSCLENIVPRWPCCFSNHFQPLFYQTTFLSEHQATSQRLSVVPLLPPRTPQSQPFLQYSIHTSLYIMYCIPLRYCTHRLMVNPRPLLASRDHTLPETTPFPPTLLKKAQTSSSKKPAPYHIQHYHNMHVLKKHDMLNLPFVMMGAI